VSCGKKDCREQICRVLTIDVMPGKNLVLKVFGNDSANYYGIMSLCQVSHPRIISIHLGRQVILPSIVEEIDIEGPLLLRGELSQ